MAQSTASRSCRSARSETETEDERQEATAVPRRRQNEGARCEKAPCASRRPAAATAAEEASASPRSSTLTAPMTQSTASRSYRSTRSETETEDERRKTMAVPRRRQNKGARCGKAPCASRRPAAATAAEEARASPRASTPTAPVTQSTASRSYRSVRSETETEDERRETTAVPRGRHNENARCGGAPRSCRRPAAATVADEACASPWASTLTFTPARPRPIRGCCPERAETQDRGRETRDDGSPARETQREREVRRSATL